VLVAEDISRGNPSKIFADQPGISSGG
jgi:hypothetical protein